MSKGMVILLLCLAVVGPAAAKEASAPHVMFQFVLVFGERGNGPGQFNAPSDLAVDLSGNLYVADTGNDRVQKLDGNGKYITEVGRFGWEDGQFNRPTGVAAGQGLEIYVADSRNSRIQIFNLHLRLLAVVGGRDVDSPVALGTLGGIALSEAGELYVSDIDADQLVQMDTYSRIDRSFGGFGYGAGSLRRPLGLAVDEDGQTYVCDSQNDRVVIFDRFGNFKDILGEDTLREPAGVCLGPRGTLVVADTGHHRVLAFDLKTGEVVGHMGGPDSGRGPMMFQAPQAVAMGAGDMLYVLDSGNGRIQKVRALVLRRK